MSGEFCERASAQFGSGLAWLVLNDATGLEIVTTDNAQTPLTSGLAPLLTCDVWEHACYIDYRNERGDYLSEFMKMIDWDFVAANYNAIGHQRAA
jgi:Fe-Mn family superoxide dismutase